MDGLLLIDKPLDWTSFDVVAKVRGIVRAQTGVKRPKVGHCGTLDPKATGLLLIVVGTYCKRAHEFSGLDKSYTATIRLGAYSTTGDREGEKTQQNVTDIPTEDAIRSVLGDFQGSISQVPPAYSAVKVGGKRAYALARAGKSVELEPRNVTVYENQLLGYDYPWLELRCRVSAGTYIRSLAEDIGAQLGTGAYLHDLRRTSVGPYQLEDALTVDSLQEDISSYLQTVEY